MRHRTAEAPATLALACFVVALGIGCSGSDEARHLAACGRPAFHEASREPRSFVVPTPDGGRLATLWLWGGIVPWHESALVVSGEAASRRLPIHRPASVQWLGPDRLLELSDERASDASSGGPYVIDLEGRILRDLRASDRLQSPVVSPDGRWLANTRWDVHGKATLEVMPFEGPFEAVAERDDLSAAVWSPDSARLTARRMAFPRDLPRGIHHVQLLLPRDLSSETRLRENGPSDLHGVNELVVAWWGRDGIYGVGGGLLERCDPEGAGCRPIYRPPVQGSIRAASPGPPGVVYLLVNDPDPCFLDPGAREIQRLELATGRTERMLRTPDGVFLTAIDWVDVPEAKPPVESPAAGSKER